MCDPAVAWFGLEHFDPIPLGQPPSVVPQGKGWGVSQPRHSTRTVCSSVDHPHTHPTTTSSQALEKQELQLTMRLDMVEQQLSQDMEALQKDMGASAQAAHEKLKEAIGPLLESSSLSAQQQQQGEGGGAGAAAGGGKPSALKQAVDTILQVNYH